MTKTCGAIFVLAILNVLTASAQSVLLNPTASQAVTQPASTTLSTTSLNGVAYVNPASSVDVVTQINTLSSNCSSTCVIHVPSGTYTTTATTTPITLQPGQSLVGDGQSNTTITGNPTKLIVWHSTGGFPSTGGKISDLTLICGAATTECIDTGDLLYAKLEDLSVYGASTGDCVSVQNAHSWFERSQFHNLTVGAPGTANNLCNVGLHLKAPNGGTNSFGYFDWGTIYQNSANVGILVDAGANVYNGSRLSVQDNIGGGDAIQVAGVLTASFITVQGEGSGYGIHTVGIGNVTGCGSTTLPLLAANSGPNPDTHMAIDLLQCLSSNQVALAGYNGGGAATFTPRMYQGNPQVDAGLGFVLQNSTGYSAPVLWYDVNYPLSMATMQQYNPIGTLNPTWTVSGQGDVQQGGSLTVGNRAGCSPAPGAQTGNNEVWEVICGQNIPNLSFQSAISNSGAKTWGFYNVRTNSGDSQFYFGTQSDAYIPNAVAWSCAQSAGTPTSCIFVPPINFAAAIIGTTASFAQVIPGGSSPTIMAGSGSGTSPTISITGKNTAGVISLTTGTSPTSMATVATVTFNGTLGTAPQGCELMARNVNAAAFFAYVYTSAPSTTTWTILSNGSLAASTTYSWSYLCM